MVFSALGNMSATSGIETDDVYIDIDIYGYIYTYLMGIVKYRLSTAAPPFGGIGGLFRPLQHVLNLRNRDRRHVYISIYLHTY